MNQKVKNDIKYYWGKIKSDKFDQETIKGLIISIREFSQTGRYTREIGDFVAHPQRERGLLFENVDNSGWEGNTLHIVMPVEGNTLVNDLKETIKQSQIIPVNEIDPIFSKFSNGILLCILGILHNSSLQFGIDNFIIKIEKDKSKNANKEYCLSIFAEIDKNGKMIVSTDLKTNECVEDINGVDNSLNLRATRNGLNELKLRIC